MGVFDKLKDVGEKVGDKMDDIITGKDEAEKAADKVEDAVEDGKRRFPKLSKPWTSTTSTWMASRTC